MKAFLITGVGFYHKDEKKWDGVGISILHENDIPEHIKIPGVPEGMNPSNVEVTIVVMEAVTDPRDGMNDLKGLLISSDRDKARSVVRDIRDKIESGKFDPIKGNGGEDVNPIDDFIFKNGTKDFFHKN
jgi:hypothetical protein